MIGYGQYAPEALINSQQVIQQRSSQIGQRDRINPAVQTANKDDEEGRYGYGTTQAVEALLKRIASYKTPMTGLVCINVDTLVRNAAGPNLKIGEVVDKVRAIMGNIANDFANLVAEWRDHKHTIIFYHIDAMQIVPEIYRRQHNGPTAMLTKESLNMLLERLRRANPDQTTGNVTSQIRIAGHFRQPSYKGIYDLLGKCAPGSVTAHMISHQPIDWHIQRMGRLCNLYRSHTGEVVVMTPGNLGQVVFDEPVVPFYPVTHQLLGDKSFIKGILVRNAKEEFIKLARRERFSMRSEGFINDHRQVRSYIIPYKLN